MKFLKHSFAVSSPRIYATTRRDLRKYFLASTGHRFPQNTFLNRAFSSCAVVLLKLRNCFPSRRCAALFVRQLHCDDLMHASCHVTYFELFFFEAVTRTYCRAAKKCWVLFLSVPQSGLRGTN